jgi:hypothetical protein
VSYFLRYEKRRYIFVVKNNDITSTQITSTFKAFFGKLCYNKASVRPILEHENWVVIRVNHLYLPQLRAAVLLTGEIGDLFSLVTSGTLTGIIRSLKRRKEGQKYVQTLELLYKAGRKKCLQKR